MEAFTAGIYSFANEYSGLDPELKREAWIKFIRPTLYETIGWGRRDKNPCLSSSAAWGIAETTIYDTLWYPEKDR